MKLGAGQWSEWAGVRLEIRHSRAGNRSGSWRWGLGRIRGGLECQVCGRHSVLRPEWSHTLSASAWASYATFLVLSLPQRRFCCPDQLVVMSVCLGDSRWPERPWLSGHVRSLFVPLKTSKWRAQCWTFLGASSVCSGAERTVFWKFKPTCAHPMAQPRDLSSFLRPLKACEFCLE